MVWGCDASVSEARLGGWGGEGEGGCERSSERARGAGRGARGREGGVPPVRAHHLDGLDDFRNLQQNNISISVNTWHQRKLTDNK